MGVTFVLTLDGVTIVRTRGMLALQLVSSAAISNGFQGAFGLGVATSAAVTAGIGSLPTPITEEDWDGWYYHSYFSILSGGVIDGSAAGDQDLTNPHMAALRLTVDSKAMRKLRVDETLYAAIEVTEEGTASMSASYNSRSLFKLP